VLDYWLRHCVVAVAVAIAIAVCFDASCMTKMMYAVVQHGTTHTVPISITPVLNYLYVRSKGLHEFLQSFA